MGFYNKYLIVGKFDSLFSFRLCLHKVMSFVQKEFNSTHSREQKKYHSFFSLSVWLCELKKYKHNCV